MFVVDSPREAFTPLGGARRYATSESLNSLDSYYDDQNYMQLFRVSQRASGVDYDIEYMKERVRSVTLEQAAAAARKINMDTVYFLKGVQS